MARRRMNYYLNDGFPMLQDPAAGPYPAFPGTPIGTVSPSPCRLRVPLIRGLGAFGDVPDVIQGMVSEGYDPSVISGLVSAGAMESQLQSLWDNYEPGTADFAMAASEQLFLLTSGRHGHLTIPTTNPPAAPPPAAATATHPTIQTQAPTPQATTNVPYYVHYEPQLQPTWWQRYGNMALIGGGILGVVILFHRR